MIYFVLDANAAARCYFDDIGTGNMMQILAYSDSLFVVPNIIRVEVTSALLASMNEGLLSRDEVDSAIANMGRDFSRPSFVPIRVSDWHLDAAVELLRTHKGLPGRNIGGVDAIYLAIACHFGRMAPPEDKVILVTSDMALYNCALAEPGIEAFHFWTCQCPKCGTVLIPAKGRDHHCPGPDCDFECLPCSLANCRSVYTVSFA